MRKNPTIDCLPFVAERAKAGTPRGRSHRLRLVSASEPRPYDLPSPVGVELGLQLVELGLQPVVGSRLLNHLIR